MDTIKSNGSTNVESMCQDRPKLMLSGIEMLSIYIASTAIFNQFYLKGANTLEQKKQMENWSFIQLYCLKWSQNNTGKSADISLNSCINCQISFVFTSHFCHIIDWYHKLYLWNHIPVTHKYLIKLLFPTNLGYNWNFNQNSIRHQWVFALQPIVFHISCYLMSTQI